MIDIEMSDLVIFNFDYQTRNHQHNNEYNETKNKRQVLRHPSENINEVDTKLLTE